MYITVYYFFYFQRLEETRAIEQGPINHLDQMHVPTVLDHQLDNSNLDNVETFTYMEL